MGGDSNQDQRRVAVEHGLFVQLKLPCQNAENGCHIHNNVEQSTEVHKETTIAAL